MALQHKALVACVACSCRDGEVIRIQKEMEKEDEAKFGREAAAVVMLECCFEFGPHEVKAKLCDDHLAHFNMVRSVMAEETGGN